MEYGLQYDWNKSLVILINSSDSLVGLFTLRLGVKSIFSLKKSGEKTYAKKGVG